VFVPGATPPAKAQFCKSPKQGLTLTFQSAPVRNQKVISSVLEKRLTN